MSGIYEELQEEDLLDIFTEFGPIKTLHFNIDKRTGYAKGYALIEYEKGNAEKAIEKMNGEDIAGQKVKVDWAFKKEKKRRHRRRRSRSRSRS